MFKVNADDLAPGPSSGNPRGSALLRQAAVEESSTLLLSSSKKGIKLNAKNKSASETPLHHAAVGAIPNKRLEIIASLIEEGKDPYTRDKDDNTFLHVFLLQKGTKPTPSEFHELAEYLIEKNLAELFHTSGGESQVTPLQLAVSFIELEEETLEFLRSHEVKFDAVNKEGDALLGVAIIAGRSAGFVNTLMTIFGADPLHLNLKMESAIHIAARSRSVELLNAILIFLLEADATKKLDKELINAKDSNGHTPLHVALHEENRESGSVLEKCKLLIQYGADVNLRTATGTFEDETPLHLAVIGRNKDDMLEVFKLLVENGAKIRILHNYCTVFHNYVRQKNTPTPSEFHNMIEYLVTHGHFRLFNIRAEKQKFTPLLWAIKILEIESRTFDLLADKRINFGIQDNMNNSALFYAVEGRRSTNQLSILMDRFKQDWKHRNLGGDSLIHHAARNGTVEALKFLLELEGLDVNEQDICGVTPLHYLMQHPQRGEILEMGKILIGKGADVGKIDYTRKTPLDWFKCHEYGGVDKAELIEILTPKGGTKKAVASVGSQSVSPTTATGEKRKKDGSSSSEDNSDSGEDEDKKKKRI